MPVTNRVCPECKSQRIWRKGKVPGRHGLKVRYLCYHCGKSFYAPGQYEKKGKKKG